MSYYRNLILTGNLNDADALAFINAAGITDSTQKKAINTLVVNLKSNGLWTKMIAIYPIVGGTATTHKYNLKDPQDTNAAFRLGFNGTITHSSSGIQGNGAVGTYINTFITPSTCGVGLDDMHLSFYSRTSTNDTAARREMGVITNTTYLINMLVRFSDNLRTQVNSNTLSSSVNSSGTAGACHVTMSRLSSSIQSAYRNGTLVSDYSVSSTGLPTKPLYLLALNNDGTAAFFSTRQCAFATVGYGLNATESLNLYNIIQAYQTTLGRQV